MRLLSLYTVILLTTAAELEARPQRHWETPYDQRRDDAAAWKPEETEGLLSRMFGARQKPILGNKQAASIMAKHAGDVVLRFTIKNKKEGKELADAANELYLDVWSSTKDHVDLRIAKDSLDYLLDLAPSLKNSYTPLIPDLGKAMMETFPDSLPSPPTKTTAPNRTPLTDNEENIFFHDYQPLHVMSSWMNFVQSIFPEIVSVISVGRSYEGRDIKAFRIGQKNRNYHTPRKTVIINGGSHAREWISTSTVNFLAYSLITNYGRDRMVTQFVDDFDWIIIPSLNVDGYAYTWEKDRLWRKNRQPTAIGYCKGVDLDRSFGFQWDDPSHSASNPCADNYQGDKPFAAQEAQVLADFAKNLTETEGAEITGFLDFHSYSQQILYPYSYSCDTRPPSLEDLEELSLVLTKAIRVYSGEHYSASSACAGSGFLAKAGSSLGGSALDYFYRVLDVKFAYQVKLRDTGSYGFLLPKANIVPTGKEAFELLKAFGKFVTGNKDPFMTSKK